VGDCNEISFDGGDHRLAAKPNAKLNAKGQDTKVLSLKSSGA
jgi:hypothetical protein